MSTTNAPAPARCCKLAAVGHADLCEHRAAYLATWQGQVDADRGTPAPAGALRAVLGPPSARAVETAVGARCPHCGAVGPHEDNEADRQEDLTFLCSACGEQWASES